LKGELPSLTKGIAANLAMVERESSESSAVGGNLLQSAKFADGDRFHIARSCLERVSLYNILK
jgi:hypothetical protein